jgi:hypothetical protein
VESDEHPLRYLLHLHGWKATGYLTHLSPHYRRLGYGSLDTTQRKRVSRWLNEGVVPELPVQRAMAALHGVPQYEVTARPWPAWLALACIRDRALLDAPWTPQSTTTLLDRIAAFGDTMDRRAFALATAVSPLIAQAVTAGPAGAREHGRRIGASTPKLFEESLAVLRRQDDQLGSGHVYTCARAQLRVIASTLAQASYAETTGRRLYAAAAEAARICGWTAYDSGRHALAEEFYITALRAAASAGDPAVTANTLAFWAILRYSTGDPGGAADLVGGALRQAPAIGSARMEAMLHSRLGRAHAKAGDLAAADRAHGAAFAAYERALDRHDEEPDCVYWVTLGELHMLAGSSALNLGEPRRALAHFGQASASVHDRYQEDAFPRGAAIYLARDAEARVALGDLDGAVATAQRAVSHLGGVDSARGSSTLTDLRARFSAHRRVPAVRDWLEATAA